MDQFKLQDAKHTSGAPDFRIRNFCCVQWKADYANAKLESGQ